MRAARLIAVFAFIALPFAALAADYPAPKQGEWVARDFKFHTGETIAEVRLAYTTVGEPSGEPVLVLHGTSQRAAAMLTPAFAGELFGAGQRLMSQGWQRAENGFSRDYFHDFVFLPGATPAMLVATADKSPGYWDRPERAQGAVFRSRDLAESWERVGVGKWLPENMQQMVWALAQHPEDASIVYAGLGAVSRGRSKDARQKGHGDILVSTDQGDSWDRLPVDLPADRVLFVAADA